MTKGAALIEARRLLGPSGHVRYGKDLESLCQVGTFGGSKGFVGITSAPTWNEALRACEEYVQVQKAKEELPPAA